MFKKLRYAYHLSVCERMIRKGKYINHTTYQLTEKFKRHRNKLNKLMTE